MADAIQNIANALFMPYVVAMLLGIGLFLTLRFALRAATAVPGGVSRDARAAGARRGRGALAVSGFHDRARRVHRHRQHRGCRDGDHLRRARRAVLDLGLRPRRHGDQVLGSRARREFGASRPPGRSPARCTTCATGSSRRRSPGSTCCSPGSALDDDAVHAAELDRRGRERRIRRADVDRRASP